MGSLEYLRIWPRVVKHACKLSSMWPLKIHAEHIFISKILIHTYLLLEGAHWVSWHFYSRPMSINIFPDCMSSTLSRVQIPLQLFALKTICILSLLLKNCVLQFIICLLPPHFPDKSAPVRQESSTFFWNATMKIQPQDAPFIFFVLEGPDFSEVGKRPHRKYLPSQSSKQQKPHLLFYNLQQQ